jgi:MFS family permease
MAALPGAAALAVVKERSVPTAGGARLRTLMDDPLLHHLMVVHVASFGFGIVLAAWTVPLLERAGHQRAIAGLLGGLVLLLGIASRPLGGMLARSRPDYVAALLVAALGLGATGTALLAIAPGSSIIALVGATLVGAATGVPFSAVIQYAAAARPEAPGAAVAAVNTVTVIAIVGLTPMLGLTFSLPGDGRIGVGALAVVWLVATAATARGSRRPLGAVPRLVPNAADGRPVGP